MTYTYRYLGAFRLLLAALVVFQHFTANVAPQGFTDAVQGYETGSVAVLVFFCLSGFVIAEAVDVAYAGRPVAFFANRLLRILPHFILAMAFAIGAKVYFSCSCVLHAEAFSVHNILLNFAGVLPGINKHIPFNFIPIIWAVQVEMLFYAVMAGCIALSVIVRRSFAQIAAYALVPLVVCFGLSLYGKLPATLGFVPYFSYGAALYFALKGERAGWRIAALTIPAMIWQFLLQPDHHPVIGFAREVSAQLCMLAVLIAAMTWLARQRFGWLRIDQKAAQYTYPLYLYHYVVMTAVLSMNERTYNWFLGGMVASLVFAAAMAQIVDPLIDRARARLRHQQMPR